MSVLELHVFSVLAGTSVLKPKSYRSQACLIRYRQASYLQACCVRFTHGGALRGRQRAQADTQRCKRLSSCVLSNGSTARCCNGERQYTAASKELPGHASERPGHSAICAPQCRLGHDVSRAKCLVDVHGYQESASVSMPRLQCFH